ncbi:helix-turn-helix domain-containing protein [Aeromicrobium sp. UC242_57]|uniref:helix-turn-helix domain-containing protein n=1 Tax=Aeromicrobium sp. UC242_57 TaxID=3374624 RepID=UPI0037B1FAA8
MATSGLDDLVLDQAEVPRAVPDDFLLTTGVFDTEEKTRWQPHTHDEHELLWCERGVVTMLADDRLWTVPPGMGLWIPRGVVHEGQVESNVAFRATFFSPESWTRGWDRPVAVKVNPAVQQLLVHLAATDMPQDERLRAQQVCIDMLSLARSFDLDVPVPQDPRLRSLVDSVLNDPSDDRSLEQWAGRLNLSSRTITRTFSADLGISFAQWRRLVRMRSALGLLATGMSVSMVGRRVGYGTTSAFVAAFRTVVGCTPGDVRDGS